MSNISNIQLSRYIPTEAIEKENRQGWIDYGDNNLYPQYLINLYYNSPIHNALTNSIAYMIEGQGTGTILDNALQGIAFDLKLQGAFCAEVIWSMDFTRVVKINHLPFENCRLAYDKEEEEITGIWYSKDWKNYRNKKGKPEFIPAFNPSQAQEQPRQVIYAHGMMAGSSYYAKPDYFGALNYIELSHQMGLYHVNNILNGLFPSFIINFLNGIPQKEEREAIRREWEERLSGANNAGKFLMTFNEDPTRTPDIQAFPLSDADKQYQFLSEETSKQIMVGHRIVSPLIHGIREANGFGSNKDEMLVGLEIFNSQVIKPYQRIIEDVFTPILGEVNIELNTIFEDSNVVEVKASKKKVVTADKRKITQEESEAWLNHLKSKAEYINEEEWELLSDEEVTNPEEEENFRSEFMSVRGYSNPEKKDEKDTGLYKVRYYYSKNFTYKDGEMVTRDFCQEMVALSKMGALFRYEDIIQMGKDGVNDTFAPAGSSTYSIWTYKGGVYCRHAWFRKVFFRKKMNGKFLPNDGLKNDKVVTGAIANELFPKGEESVRPNDMPNRASLKYK